jgi:putative effector of murein hydrolase LrgA (UPF0299 family)
MPAGMNGLVFVFVCLALGIVIAHTVRPPATLASSLNWWVELEPALAGSVLGIGILLSLATVPWINTLL